MTKFKVFIEENDISGYVDGQEDLKLAKEKLSKKTKRIYLSIMLLVL